MMGLSISVILLAVAAVTGVWILTLRRVVPPNQVHVVQRRKTTQSYGNPTTETDADVARELKINGNVYYEWPSFIPVIGLTKTVLPVSIFKLPLEDYEAYDIGKVPFMVDVMAFFRIADTNLAAQRIQDESSLRAQLMAIVQGAIRTVLAKSEINEIMEERSTFGEAFTSEIDHELKSWGVVAVKNMELMDIRDAEGNKVIWNIMEKKKSLVERESRVEVAENKKLARQAEIDAQKEVDLRDQEAIQIVGQRTAEQTKEVGIANEVAKQQIKEQERETKEREMAVLKVHEVRDAEIKKEAAVVKADEDKQTTILVAEGDLRSKELEAAGIEAEGNARALAEREMQRAPVVAQIELAKEIGENEGYQQYLLGIEQIEAAQLVGIEQAKALVQADVKVISNTGAAINGVTNVMDLFTSEGGTKTAAMLEALKQSPIGEALLSKLIANNENTAAGGYDDVEVMVKNATDGKKDTRIGTSYTTKMSDDSEEFGDPTSDQNDPIK